MEKENASSRSLTRAMTTGSSKPSTLPVRAAPGVASPAPSGGAAAARGLGATSSGRNVSPVPSSCVAVGRTQQQAHQQAVATLDAATERQVVQANRLEGGLHELRTLATAYSDMHTSHVGELEQLLSTAARLADSSLQRAEERADRLEHERDELTAQCQNLSQEVAGLRAAAEEQATSIVSTAEAAADALRASQLELVRAREQQAAEREAFEAQISSLKAVLDGKSDLARALQDSVDELTEQIREIEQAAEARATSAHDEMREERQRRCEELQQVRADAADAVNELRQRLAITEADACALAEDLSAEAKRLSGRRSCSFDRGAYPSNIALANTAAGALIAKLSALRDERDAARQDASTAAAELGQQRAAVADAWNVANRQEETIQELRAELECFRGAQQQRQQQQQQQQPSSDHYSASSHRSASCGSNNCSTNNGAGTNGAQAAAAAAAKQRLNLREARQRYKATGTIHADPEARSASVAANAASSIARLEELSNAFRDMSGRPLA
jgi:chromosome segregation ATPase